MSTTSPRSAPTTGWWWSSDPDRSVERHRTLTGAFAENRYAKDLDVVDLAALLAACGGPREAAPEVIVVDTPGSLSIQGEVWADNWFAFYLGLPIAVGLRVAVA